MQDGGGAGRVSQRSAAGSAAAEKETSDSTTRVLPAGAARMTTATRAMRSARWPDVSANISHGGEMKTVHGAAIGSTGRRRAQRSTSPVRTSVRATTSSAAADRRSTAAVGK